MMEILFLTSNNLATNPRLVKEIKLALKKKYRVAVIQFELNNWSDLETEKIVQSFCAPIEIHNLKAIPNNKVEYLSFGLMEIFSKFVYPLQRKSFLINAFGHSRRSYQMVNRLKNMDLNPDLIVGHNLAALYPAYLSSLRFAAPFIFDVEDYHPGESCSNDTINEGKRREFLMKTLLPNAAALTFASPLISKYTLDLIGKHPYSAIILNGFLESEFNLNNEENSEDIEKLKFVWFSQNISFNRGLEQFFMAIEILMKRNKNPKIEITLIGEMNNSFYETIIQPFKNLIKDSNIDIYNIALLSQKQLHKKLNYFDVGLALEPGKDLNNEIAISNKILAYSQAGLYILATDTLAQRDFINSNPNLGMLSVQTVEQLSECIDEIYTNRREIIKSKGDRFALGRQYSWDNEQTKLLEIWINSI